MSAHQSITQSNIYQVISCGVTSIDLESADGERSVISQAMARVSHYALQHLTGSPRRQAQLVLASTLRAVPVRSRFARGQTFERRLGPWVKELWREGKIPGHDKNNVKDSPIHGSFGKSLFILKCRTAARSISPACNCIMAFRSTSYISRCESRADDAAKVREYQSWSLRNVEHERYGGDGLVQQLCRHGRL